MPRSRPSAIDVVLLVAALAACSDPAEPALTQPALTFIGPDRASPRAGVHPDGSPRVECEATIVAQLSSRDRAQRARWTGGTLRWTAAAAGPPSTSEMPAAELSAFWGIELVPDVPSTAAVRFWADEPFDVELYARYVVGDDPNERTARYALRCAPPAPPLTGRWAMTMIDGRRLPTAFGFSTLVLAADTLEFLPNLTYTSRAYLGAHGEERRDMPATPYDIPHADSVALPYFLQHMQAWTAVRTENTLVFTGEPAGGWAATVVRFDRVGSTPDLPPEPRFVAVPAAATLSAVVGGAPPPPLRIAVSSAAPTQLFGISLTGESTCVVTETRTICPFDVLLTSLESSATPTTLVVTALRTDLPPGVYAATIYLTGINVPRQVVPVTYTVRAP